MYDYDRRSKTAAKMDLHSKWRDIVDKHRKAEAKDMERLLKSCVAPLKKVGLDLNLQKSFTQNGPISAPGSRPLRNRPCAWQRSPNWSTASRC